MSHYCGSSTRNILMVLNPEAAACPYMEVGPCCGFVEERAMKPYKYVLYTVNTVIVHSSLYGIL